MICTFSGLANAKVHKINQYTERMSTSNNLTSSFVDNYLWRLYTNKIFSVVPGEPPPTTPPPTTVPTTTPERSLTCDEGPCQNGGECSMIDASEYYCFCEDGFEGTNCEIGKFSIGLKIFQSPHEL